MPARKPETANAITSAPRVPTAYACAARSLSRTPMSTRPIRLLRRPRTIQKHSPKTTMIERVERGLAVHRDDAEHVRAGHGDGAVRYPALERRVADIEEIARREERERERGHREREAARPQGRGADEHGGDRADRARDREDERDVPVPARRECSRDRAGDADECHLPEAHLSGPSGEHHEREPDDREDADRPDQLHVDVGDDERE